MTIKFEDMEPDAKQSALRVIEDQFSRLTINGPGYEEAAKEVVNTVKVAFQSLYEDKNLIEIKVETLIDADKHKPLGRSLHLSTRVTSPSRDEVDEIAEKIATEMTGVKITAQSTAEYMKKVVKEVASRIRVDVNGFSAGLR